MSDVDQDFDVAIVGAGINGCVIAASLAAHGVSVLLVDKGDIAGYTSQASSNMIWGGFKYLEGLDLPLVWGLCGSRNDLIDAYPTNVVPITFMAILDHDSPHRPWFAYIGTLAYWAFGRFRTSRPRYMTRRSIVSNARAVDTSNTRGGVAYSDAYLPENDARFVLQFALSAADRGAVVLNHTAVTAASSSSTGWELTLVDASDGQSAVARASVLVNASGPFADAFNEMAGVTTEHRLALSKGIHLIVDRLTDPSHVLVFYDDAGRLFYVLPMGERSSIGTTDTRSEVPTQEVTDADRDFLLAQINARLDLQEPLTPDDVISTRAGVRPLVVAAGSGETSSQDWTKLSRKHVVEVDGARKIVSVLGGKLTDCLNVGEELAEIVSGLGIDVTQPDQRWYGEAPESFRAESVSHAAEAGFSQATCERLWRRYGPRMNDVVGLVASSPDLSAPCFEFDDLRLAEVALMTQTEFVMTLEDLFRRRTMLELTHGRRRLSEASELSRVAAIAFGEDAAAAAVAAYRNQ